MPRVEKTERTRRAHHDEDMEPMIMLVAAACGAANQDILGVGDNPPLQDDSSARRVVRERRPAGRRSLRVSGHRTTGWLREPAIC